MRCKLLPYFVWSHALYILITAVWPLVHIQSFMAVTGPKTDIWLVKTVGALLIPIALTLVISLRFSTSMIPLIALGTTTCIAFLTIDIYYTATETISNIYLVDAAIEFLFLVGWIFVSDRRNLNDNKTGGTSH